jgi:hypothetical protein
MSWGERGLATTNRHVTRLKALEAENARLKKLHG